MSTTIDAPTRARPTFIRFLYRAPDQPTQGPDTRRGAPVVLGDRSSRYVHRRIYSALIDAAYMYIQHVVRAPLHTRLRRTVACAGQRAPHRACGWRCLMSAELADIPRAPPRASRRVASTHPLAAHPPMARDPTRRSGTVSWACTARTGGLREWSRVSVRSPA
ncbi:hypothetical protein HYPSUDRAFT_34748 [Hypholoma sublateritium FD-334 SS-4]|uniref:Uncharacterized protein n=1 Tax=Hypholoma sublateritium (strain FD-334 SS-4) TaxID=945553 RepID=A0A0D2MUG3_HYPSF|nr:hypothetical protein HYPSUDRAFT_34748 [Hypholoma sublateritium FD-334 SS-4]